MYREDWWRRVPCDCRRDRCSLAAAYPRPARTREQSRFFRVVLAGPGRSGQFCRARQRQRCGFRRARRFRLSGPDRGADRPASGAGYGPWPGHGQGRRQRATATATAPGTHPQRLPQREPRQRLPHTGHRRLARRDGNGSAAARHGRGPRRRRRPGRPGRRDGWDQPGPGRLAGPGLPRCPARPRGSAGEGRRRPGPARPPGHQGQAGRDHRYRPGGRARPERHGRRPARGGVPGSRGPGRGVRQLREHRRLPRRRCPGQLPGELGSGPRAG